MSTQQKSTPEIYHDLPDIRPNICIMEDNAAHFSLHNNPESIEKLKSFNAIIKDSIQKIWATFDAFTKENKNTVLAYHENLFSAEPPKNQNIIITATYCWRKMQKIATADLTSQVPVTASGRKSTIGTCEYRPGPTQGDGQLKTPQARECLKMFRECFEQKHGDRNHITEEELRKYIEDNVSRLHTKQPAWRIFQYYRPELIAQNLIHRK
jgi:hypothetical protein